MKIAINAILYLILICFMQDAIGQDIIIKKDGKKIRAKVSEINDTEIKYFDYDDPNGVLFTIDRAIINEIKFQHGNTYIEETPGDSDIYYLEDKRNNIKVNFTAFAGNTMAFTYERAQNKFSSIETTLKIYGLGVQNNSNEENSGFGVHVGYKLKLGSVRKKRNDYRPPHILDGWYLRPTLGYSYAKRTRSYEYAGYPPERYEFKRNIVHGGLDFGIQKIINNVFSIDVYTGFHYVGGKYESTINGVSDVYYNTDISDGDLAGDGSFAISYGVRVGFLFGTKSTENSSRGKN